MVQPTSGRNLLMLAHEGMQVYDRDNEKVGKVDFVYLGDVSEEEDQMGKGPYTTSLPDTGRDDSLLETVAEAFGRVDDVPDVVRKRLARNGFLRVDGAGLFASDRFVEPDQIDAVDEDGIRLSVTRDELIRR